MSENTRKDDGRIPDEQDALLAADLQRQAVIVYLWFLANLTVLPVIAFVMLLKKRRSIKQQSEFIYKHYRQAIWASIVAGILLALVSIVIAILGGLSNPATWVVLIIYFTLCHSLFIILGVVGLSRASAGKEFRFLSAASWMD